MGFPGARINRRAAEENWDGESLPTFLFQSQLSQPRSLEIGVGPGAVFRPSLPTLLPEGRAESKADAAGKALGSGNARVSGRRAREGWPSEQARESPSLGAVPTHLSREVITRTAGRGALGGLAIPGGSGARRARHVSGREVSCGRRQARDSAGTAPP